jgi:DNA-binding response OmpR family regulator
MIILEIEGQRMISGKRSGTRVIVVEDEPVLLDNLVIGLTACGLQVRGVADGASLDSAMADQPVDVVVLDLGLPVEDGVDIANRLKGRADLGLIMVTARSSADDRILGLESGADCYFIKPVNIAELAVSIRNLERRLVKGPDTSWQLNTESSTLSTPSGISAFLTDQECRLMRLLCKKPGVNVTYQEIFLALGQPDDIYAKARLEVLVSRLRSKIVKADMTSPLPIKARHSIGYVFLAG